MYIVKLIEEFQEIRKRKTEKQMVLNTGRNIYFITLYLQVAKNLTFLSVEMMVLSDNFVGVAR